MTCNSNGFQGYLHLETTRSTTTTSLLELPALGPDVRLLVLVRTETEVLDSLAGVLLATDEDGVATGGGAGGELVEGEALTTGSLDAGTCGVGESESSDGELGKLEDSVVVGDGADNDDGLGGLGGRSGNTTLRLGQVDDARDRDRRLVDLGHVESAENGLVESAVGAASEEAVELWCDEWSRWNDKVSTWSLITMKCPWQKRYSRRPLQCTILHIHDCCFPALPTVADRLRSRKLVAPKIRASIVIFHLDLNKRSPLHPMIPVPPPLMNSTLA